MANLKKQGQLDALIDFIKKSPNFALLKHEKTKHIALEGLRKELRASNATIKVIKNSLLDKAIRRLAGSNEALKTFGKKILPLRDNTAIISFGEDWSKGLGSTFTFSQKDQTVTFKAGVLDNSVYTGADLLTIAKLPSRPQLVAQLIGNMKSPMTNFVYGLKFNMQKFVYILSERSKQT